MSALQALLHKEVQDLSGLLAALVDVYGKYNAQTADMSGSLLALLDLTAAMHRATGRPARQTRIESMKAELKTASRGIHPLTLEKLAVRRHEMQISIAFRVLQSLELELRGSFEAAASSLQQAEDLAGQILVAAMQKGLVDDAMLAATNTQAAIGALWRSIAADADIHMAQKRVLLIVSVYDAYLLIDKVLTKLRLPAEDRAHVVPARLSVSRLATP